MERDSPGGAKVTKIDYFSNNLAKTKNIYLIVTYDNKNIQIIIAMCCPQYM